MKFLKTNFLVGKHNILSYLNPRNIGRNVDIGSYYRKLSGLTDIIEINIEIKIV